jgi:O-methyltransferase
MIKIKYMSSLSLFTIKKILQVEETKAVLDFIFSSRLSLPYKEKMSIIKKLYLVSHDVDCPHTHEEILAFIKTVLLLPKDINGCVVEAGCYKGGSTSKFSLAAKIANRNLVIFDSFQGIPGHTEPHRYNIYGKPVSFTKGEYCGSINEVKTNIKKYGNIEMCTFKEGWFKDTLVHFKKPIAAMYIDVDLAESVKECLRHLYPLLVEGGTLYCQDGHLPLVIQVLDDDNFWLNEVGHPKPQIEGLGKKKLIKIIKKVYNSNNQATATLTHNYNN